MESQTRCSDTTGANIPNTSGNPARGKYTLSDLHRLTFRLEDMEQVFDVETCTAEQFNAFAEAVSDVEDVDIMVWPLEERRNLVNEVWDFCLAENFDFPLTEITGKSASEAEGA
jgi:hypothetical protein